jgi:hypothetical protein
MVVSKCTSTGRHGISTQMLSYTRLLLHQRALFKLFRMIRRAMMCILRAQPKNGCTCSISVQTKKFGKVCKRVRRVSDVAVSRAVCRCWTNDAMVNALYVNRDGMRVHTGDSKVIMLDPQHLSHNHRSLSKGVLKIWDVRQNGEPELTHTEQSGQPISHLHTSPNFRQKLSSVSGACCSLSHLLLIKSVCYSCRKRGRRPISSCE